MIDYQIGDLFPHAYASVLEGHPTVVAHCCNCFNTMKSGIAPLVAKNFPEAESVDKLTTKGDRGKLGTTTEAFSQGILVFNLYGQFGYWKRREGKMDLEYPALDSALGQMAASIHAKCRVNDIRPNEVKVLLPMIGAGLAGGDWNVISQLIEKNLGKFSVTVFKLK
ncbi:hypothetical protein KASHIRA_02630 [Serratia phage vB_SmaM-Kashira]|nr:putative phosphatase [Acinetobacter phage ABPH49]URC22837.1 hypothetical protein KASHIRA_02630 [Serratia phage vB_SmaM-Kashira]